MMKPNAILQATVSWTLALAANILAGAFIFYITTTRNGSPTLDWSRATFVWPFWAMIALLVAGGAYSYRTILLSKKREDELTSYKDAEYVRAKAMQELWAALMEKAEQDIRDGSMKTIDQVFEMLGSNRGQTK